MDDVIFYLISSFLFLVIIKESMGIFFIKKDVPSLFSVVSWIIFYIVEVIGTNIITIPIMMLLFELASGFILCTVLYEGSFRKKLIWIFLINLMGMITEAIVGYIFIFVNMSVEQLKLLGSFISKIILLMSNYSEPLLFKDEIRMT